MPALRNGSAAPRKRGPQHAKQQCVTADSRSEVRPTAMSTTSASVSGPQRSSGRWSAHRSRLIATQKGAKRVTTGKGVALRGKSGESCAWPAYARSSAEAEAEALAAVSSLYADELKPFGRILRKRVAEQILERRGIIADVTNLDALPEVDAKQVRAVCESCERLCIEEEEGGDWSAVFVDRPPTFIDVYSPADCYHEQFWSGLRAYCEGPKGNNLSLPGGRYACAQALKALQLPLLENLSLGRICHVVQLAISQKKVLGYLNGSVVPYATSQSMMKDRCALIGQPSTGNNNGQNSTSAMPIASLEMARKHVLEILDTANGEVPLSNVKRLFRSRYHLELSETSFGYSKLSELLQDSMFSDICRVELRGHGYTVIQTGQKSDYLAAMLPPAAAPSADGLRRVPLCADEPLSFDAEDSLTEDAPMVFAPTPTRMSAVAEGFIACSVQHTFLQYKVPQTPLPGPKRRSYSLPKDMGRSEWPLASGICSDYDKGLSAPARLLPKHFIESESTTDGSDLDVLRNSLSGTRTDSGSSVGFSSEEASFGSVSQLPSELSHFGRAFLHSDRTDDAMSLVTPKGSEPVRRRVIVGPDERLMPEEPGTFWGRSPGTTPLPTPTPMKHAAILPEEPGTFWGRSPGTTPLPTPTPMKHAAVLTPHSDYVCHVPAPSASLGHSSMRAMDADSETGIVASSSWESAKRRVIFCPDEPLGFEEAGSSSQPIPSPAPMLPSPSMTPSPTYYYYSNPAQCRRPFTCSSTPHAPSTMSFTTATSIRELGCAGTLFTPTAESGNFCAVAPPAPRQSFNPGCVIRLGEHL